MSILTSPSGTRMLTYVAPIYDNSRVMQAVFQANGIEIDNLQTWVQEIRYQAFPQTATWGMKYWEQSLGITVDELKPINQRREYVISKLIGVGTPTKKLIEDTAKSYTNGDIDITVLPSYTFMIEFISEFGVPENVDQFKETIANIKPAHMTVTYKYRYMLAQDFDSYNLTAGDFDDLNVTAAEFGNIDLSVPSLRSIGLTMSEQ